ncbi:MAG: VOC family protein [Phycisphaeraceae bacterium]|nr:MAG: VOC family protein [Phycisphaeraceae bacterium]
MPNDLAHFAIHADDCARAKQFYESAFGWRFEAWGPPDFWRIHTSPGAVGGALQKRQHPVEGRGMIGYECTIAVEDVQAAASAIEAAGGRVLMKPFTIERVGALIQFQDTEGNHACAMQYEPGARP